jgi:hypothetical protein
LHLLKYWMQRMALRLMRRRWLEFVVRNHDDGGDDHSPCRLNLDARLVPKVMLAEGK